MTTEIVTNDSFLKKLVRWASIVFLVYLVLLAVATVGSGFKIASGGADGAKEVLAFATNPFMGLIVGVLATALVQSSSTVTSVIVGLVAGGLPISMAVPMIMGANIGTTITNTIVSLGHVKSKREFRRAFTAATMHDFFNLFNVLIFLPLEIAFGILEKMAGWMSSFMMDSSNLSPKSLNFIKPITKPIIGIFKDALEGLPSATGGTLLSVFGVLMIFTAITLLGKLLREVMVGQAKDLLHQAIGKNPATGIFSGMLVTVLVQSSSTTTSLAVPLVGGGVFKPKDIYPFTLGANIGTCITAVLAATAFAGEPTGIFAMQIALVHLLYNSLGVAILFGIPYTRYLPVKMAKRLAFVATENKALVAAYVLGVFFVIPGILTFIVS